ALLWLRARIDDHLVLAKAIDAAAVRASDIHHVVHLRGLLVELRRYLVANRGSLINYGAAYRRAERVATARGIDREPSHEPADVQEAPDAVDTSRRPVHAPRADRDDQ